MSFTGGNMLFAPKTKIVEFFACGHARTRPDLVSAENSGGCSSPVPFDLGNSGADLIDAAHLFSFTPCPLDTCQSLDIPGTVDSIAPKLSGTPEGEMQIDAVLSHLAQYEFRVVDLAFQVEKLDSETVEIAGSCACSSVVHLALNKLLGFGNGRNTIINLNAVDTDGVRNVLQRMEISFELDSPVFMIDTLYLIAMKKLNTLSSDLEKLENFVNKLSLRVGQNYSEGPPNCFLVPPPDSLIIGSTDSSDGSVSMDLDSSDSISISSSYFTDGHSSPSGNLESLEGGLNSLARGPESEHIPFGVHPGSAVAGYAAADDGEGPLSLFNWAHVSGVSDDPTDPWQQPPMPKQTAQSTAVDVANGASDLLNQTSGPPGQCLDINRWVDQLAQFSPTENLFTCTAESTGAPFAELRHKFQTQKDSNAETQFSLRSPRNGVQLSPNFFDEIQPFNAVEDFSISIANRNPIRFGPFLISEAPPPSVHASTFVPHLNEYESGEDILDFFKDDPCYVITYQTFPETAQYNPPCPTPALPPVQEQIDGLKWHIDEMPPPTMPLQSLISPTALPNDFMDLDAWPKPYFTRQAETENYRTSQDDHAAENQECQLQKEVDRFYNELDQAGL